MLLLVLSLVEVELPDQRGNVFMNHTDRFVLFHVNLGGKYV
jgi:hypothetical protein